MRLCNDEAAKLDFLNDQLSGRKRARVTRHVETCVRCRRELEELAGVIGALAGLPRTVAPPEVRQRVEDALSGGGLLPGAERRGDGLRQWPLFLVAVGAVALAVAELIWVALTMPGPQLASALMMARLAQAWHASVVVTAVSVTVATAVICLPSAVESLYVLLATGRSASVPRSR
jgi:anti-sigma factor RsiW